MFIIEKRDVNSPRLALRQWFRIWGDSVDGGDCAAYLKSLVESASASKVADSVEYRMRFIPTKEKQ
jgi:hypothetical protein